MLEVLQRGELVWVDLDPTRGHERRGHRPALVVSSEDYLAVVRDLVVVVPVTSVDRGWPHHVPVTGDRVALARASFAITEQPRTVSSQRLGRRTGVVDARTLAQVDQWLRDFLELR